MNEVPFNPARQFHASSGVSLVVRSSGAGGGGWLVDVSATPLVIEIGGPSSVRMLTTDETSLAVGKICGTAKLA